VGRCGWEAVKQSKIGRKSGTNIALNPKRRIKNFGDGNCETVS
jgi:hypothetical protein